MAAARTEHDCGCVTWTHGEWDACEAVMQAALTGDACIPHGGDREGCQISKIEGHRADCGYIAWLREHAEGLIGTFEARATFPHLYP